MRISDWSSDVCSSDLSALSRKGRPGKAGQGRACGLDDLAHALRSRHDGGDGAGNLPRKERHRLQVAGGGPQRRVGAEAIERPAVFAGDLLADRQSVAAGKRVSVRVDLGGRRIIKKKKTNNNA